VTEERVLITEDTDFGALLARNQSLHPSLILFRSADPLTPEEQSRLLLANLDALAEELAAGCIVSIGRGHLRVRPLPVGPDR
jgi:predicted nuclease of predicted toxin-antitoxin system